MFSYTKANVYFLSLLITVIIYFSISNLYTFTNNFFKENDVLSKIQIQIQEYKQEKENKKLNMNTNIETNIGSNIETKNEEILNAAIFLGSASFNK